MFLAPPWVSRKQKSKAEVSLKTGVCMRDSCAGKRRLGGDARSGVFRHLCLVESAQTVPGWIQSSHGNYADRIRSSSILAPAPALAEPDPSSRSDLFGEQQGRA